MATNFFDNIDLNIEALRNTVSQSKSNPKRSPLFPKLSLLFNVFIYFYISKEFIYSYFLTKWFKEFEFFWSRILKGRPIDIIDFHFLRLLYRVKFQGVEHFDESNSDNFLKAWNSNENIYLLFGNVWKYAKSAYLDFLVFFFQLPKKGKILEYGCGIAPFTTGMIKYFPSRKYTYEIVDILQINFLYAIYTLSSHKNVKHRILEPYGNLVEHENYSAIICLTVFEHIPNPLSVVKSFYDSLKKDGVLVFDYIKDEGEGLDSKKSVEERTQTIEFIKDHFRVIKGRIITEESIDLCVVKKVEK
jgi:SAM-dependent methyltransferase